jgi:hypothetical protein
MFTFEKNLGHGFSSPEDGVAPILAAKPELPAIGYLKMPEGELTYRRGSGRYSVELPMKVLFQKEDTGYSVSVRIDWLSPLSRFVIVGIAALMGCVAIVEFWTGWAAGVAALLTLILGTLALFLFFSLNDYLVAREALGDLRWAYRNRSNQSSDPTLASGTSPAGQEPRHR